MGLLGEKELYWKEDIFLICLLAFIRWDSWVVSEHLEDVCATDKFKRARPLRVNNLFELLQGS